MKKYFYLFLLIQANQLWSTDYHVGPDQSHTELDTIAWTTLVAGDAVIIHWRAQAYQTKIGLSVRGTAQQPIRIIGLRGGNNQRPVIDANNASTPPNLVGWFSAQWDEFLGAIVIKRGPGQTWGYKPGFIEISGLKIKGANPNNTYTAQDGSTQNYTNGAAAIWAPLVENLTISDCEFTENGNGLFILSKNEEQEVSRNIVVRGNYIHGNGNAGSFRHHEIYTEAAGIVFEYNRIGPLRDGALGSALKDRSSDTVIRYNWIESGARTLDLVDPEDAYNIFVNEPGFHDTWVYGNIMINRYSETKPYATSMIHYGGDTGVENIYRKGMLHFYHNTFYMEFTQSQAWNLQIFDASTNDESIQLYNNIFYLNGDSNLHLAKNYGVFDFTAPNWINSGWIEARDGFDGTVNSSANIITGASPNLTDVMALDFHPLQNSPIYDKATTLPNDVSTTHPLQKQYKKHYQGNDRVLEGQSMELGAYEMPVDDLIFINGFE